MNTSEGKRVGISRMKGINQYINRDGEVRPEPLNKISIRIKPAGIEKISKIIANIP
jgi:hypothetical protein